jgi:hypothetical protein
MKSSRHVDSSASQLCSHLEHRVSGIGVRLAGSAAERRPASETPNKPAIKPLFLTCSFAVAAMRIAVLGTLLIPLATAHADGAAAKRNLLETLIPRPQRIEALAGHFAWNQETVLVLEPGNEADRQAAETLLEACRESGRPRPRAATASSVSLPVSDNYVLAGERCRLLPLAALRRQEKAAPTPPELGDDGYVLEITPGRILLEGVTSAGVYHGFQTLIQLLHAAGTNAQLPAVRITDWTDLKWRGVSIDYGRGEVETVAAMKRFIQIMAHYKLNHLFIYLEDAFLFPSHPDIGEGRDRLTTPEALELDAFARRHHVELVPMFDSPAHIERVLALPRYAHLAEGETPPPLRTVIDTSNPETYTLLDGLYTDLAQAFPSRLMHVGGDESLALGKGRSKPLADQIGEADLYLRHLKKVRDIFVRNGKRMIVAGDPFEPDFFKPFGGTNYGIGVLSQVPRDVILQPWHYGVVQEFPFGEQARALGFEALYWSSLEAHHAYFPLFQNALANVESFIPFAHRQQALGVTHSHWGDRVPHPLREVNWPGIIHFAEWAWRENGRTGDLLFPRAMESFCGLGSGGLADTLLFLGNADRYFPWAVQFLDHAGRPLFFETFAPRELTEGQRKLLADFRRDGAGARVKFDRARAAATRHRDYFDLIAFALDQADILGDLVECRHHLARKDEESRRRAGEMLVQLGKTLPALMHEYETLWHRSRRPLGLAASRQPFERVIAWVGQTRSARVRAPGEN